MRRRDLLMLGVTSVTVGLNSGWAQADSSRGLAVVVSKKSKLLDLSVGTLRRIFLLQELQHQGLEFAPFNQPHRSEARLLFDERILGLGPEQSARYWVDQRIRGGSRPPRAIANLRLLLRVVERFPGAIAYIQEGELTSRVKALTVSGRALADPRYPLRART